MALDNPHRFAALRGSLFGADRSPALEEGVLAADSGLCHGT
ncbi:hypothetical protein [Streptomyces sp. NPDC021622]